MHQTALAKLNRQLDVRSLMQTVRSVQQVCSLVLNTKQRYLVPYFKQNLIASKETKDLLSWKHAKDRLDEKALRKLNVCLFNVYQKQSQSALDMKIVNALCFNEHVDNGKSVN